MKHIILFSTLLVLIAGLGAVNFQLNAGLDLDGSIVSKFDDYELGAYYGSQIGITLSAQVLKNYENLYYGVGVDYQLPRELGDMPSGVSSDLQKISFIPIYATVSYQFPTQNELKPQFIGHIGYSFNDFDFVSSDVWNEEYSTENGLYYAYGLGVEHHKFCVQAMIKTNNGSITIKDLDYPEENNTWDFTHRMLSISMGYRF